MQRYDFFHGQTVTSGEMNAAFDGVEDAQQSIFVDLGYFGVVNGGEVVPTATPSMAVLVGSAGLASLAYDRSGRRVSWGSQVNVNVGQDSSGVPTTVQNVGNQRIVSIFVAHDRVLSDLRRDDGGAQIWYNRADGYRFLVIQGNEAVSPVAPALPSNEQDAIRLADITLSHGQTSVILADIDVSVQDSANSLGSRPGAASVDYDGGASWADGTTNPARTVEATFDQIFSSLGGSSGATKVGSAAVAGTPTSLSAGSIGSQLAALLAAVNARVLKAGDVISGDLSIGGKLIPSVAGGLLGEAGKEWQARVTSLYATGAADVGSLNVRGTTTFQSALTAPAVTATGDVTGNNLLSGATGKVESDKVMPKSAVGALGDSTHKWNGEFNTLRATGQTTLAAVTATGQANLSGGVSTTNIVATGDITAEVVQIASANYDPADGGGLYRLHGGNTIKAWGRVGAMSVANAYNVTAVTFDHHTGQTEVILRELPEDIRNCVIVVTKWCPEGKDPYGYNVSVIHEACYDGQYRADRFIVVQDKNGVPEAGDFMFILISK